jgi:hypothetical protein
VLKRQVDDVFDLTLASLEEPEDHPSRDPVGRARRAAVAELCRLAARVAAVHGPRSRTGEVDRLRFHTAWQAVESFRSEPGSVALALRQAAEGAREGAGEVGSAVCLTAAASLAGFQALDAGACPHDLIEGLERDRCRLLSEIGGVARPPTSAELSAALARSLGLEPEELPPLPPGQPVVAPGRRPGLEVVPFRGLEVHLTLQGAHGLPAPGRRDGRQRLLRVAGPIRTAEEVRRLFRDLDSFHEPLLVLADHLSPAAATAALGMSQAGRIHGRLLWCELPPEEDRAAWDLVPVASNVLEGASLDPGDLLLAEQVLWLDGRCLLDLGDRGRPSCVLLVGPDRAADAGRVQTLIRGLQEGGVVPGGGAVYLALGRRLRGRLETPGLARALRAPLEALLTNEGMDPAAVLDRLERLPTGAGFDVLARRYFGPADPGPRVAASVAARALDAGLEAAGDLLRGVFDAQGT